MRMFRRAQVTFGREDGLCRENFQHVHVQKGTRVLTGAVFTLSSSAIPSQVLSIQ